MLACAGVDRQHEHEQGWAPRPVRRGGGRARELYADADRRLCTSQSAVNRCCTFSLHTIENADSRRHRVTGSLALIWPVMTAAFLASLVEAVEALTIVLAVATVRGWRPAGLGALAGLAVLALIVVALGPLLGHVPLRLLQFVIGVLLLLFGMRWLRKAILRAAGVIPLHDEATAFATETAELREHARRDAARLSFLEPVPDVLAVPPGG